MSKFFQKREKNKMIEKNKATFLRSPYFFSVLECKQRAFLRSPKSALILSGKYKTIIIIPTVPDGGGDSGIIEV